MYATVRRYAGSPELADVLAARQDEVLGIVSQVPGFRGYYLIRDKDATISVSVYDDEAGARQSTEAAANWFRENMPDWAGAGPEVSGGEVVVSG